MRAWRNSEPGAPRNGAVSMRRRGLLAAAALMVMCGAVAVPSVAVSAQSAASATITRVVDVPSSRTEVANSAAEDDCVAVSGSLWRFRGHEDLLLCDAVIDLAGVAADSEIKIELQQASGIPDGRLIAGHGRALVNSWIGDVACSLGSDVGTGGCMVYTGELAAFPATMSAVIWLDIASGYMPVGTHRFTLTVHDGSRLLASKTIEVVRVPTPDDYWPEGWVDPLADFDPYDYVEPEPAFKLKPTPYPALPPEPTEPVAPVLPAAPAFDQWSFLLQKLHASTASVYVAGSSPLQMKPSVSDAFARCGEGDPPPGYFQLLYNGRPDLSRPTACYQNYLDLFTTYAQARHHLATRAAGAIPGVVPAATRENWIAEYDRDHNTYAAYYEAYAAYSAATDAFFADGGPYQTWAHNVDSIKNSHDNAYSARIALALSGASITVDGSFYPAGSYDAFESCQDFAGNDCVTIRVSDE